MGPENVRNLSEFLRKLYACLTSALRRPKHARGNAFGTIAPGFASPYRASLRYTPRSRRFALQPYGT
jgi:hypothetical protein